AKVVTSCQYVTVSSGPFRVPATDANPVKVPRIKSEAQERHVRGIPDALAGDAQSLTIEAGRLRRRQNQSVGGPPDGGQRDFGLGVVILEHLLNHFVEAQLSMHMRNWATCRVIPREPGVQSQISAQVARDRHLDVQVIVERDNRGSV